MKHKFNNSTKPKRLLQVSILLAAIIFFSNSANAYFFSLPSMFSSNYNVNIEKATEAEISTEDNEKVISRKFEVQPNATLDINSDYSNVVITTWEKPTIEIDVNIKVSGKNEEKVKDKLATINVEFTESKSLVSAETKFKKSSSWSFFGFGNNDIVSVSINYVVKMPKTNNLKIRNDFGTLNIDNIDGNTDIKCDYSKLIIGKLNSKNNKLELDFCKSASFDFINFADIKGDYSKIDIQNANTLNITSDFSNISIEDLIDLEFNNDYGSLKVGNVVSINGNGDFIQTSIEVLKEKASINGNYGSLKIGQVLPTVTKVSLVSDFRKTNIGLTDNLSLKVDISSSFTKFSGLDLIGLEDKGSGIDKIFYVQVGSDKNTQNLLKINGSYGSINFIKK